MPLPTSKPSRGTCGTSLSELNGAVRSLAIGLCAHGVLHGESEPSVHELTVSNEIDRVTFHGLLLATNFQWQSTMHPQETPLLKMSNTNHTVSVSSLASLFPSCFSPQHPQVIGQRTHEFPHASHHSTHCWAHIVVLTPSVPRHRLTCCQRSKLIHFQTVGEILGVCGVDEVLATLEEVETIVFVIDSNVYFAVHRVVLLHSSGQSRRHARFFFVPVWRSRRGLGSRRLCRRTRKPRLEPDVRPSRFVIVCEIPNATPLRVAAFTRTTPPFHKMPNATPFGRLPTGAIGRKKGVRQRDVLTDRSSDQGRCVRRAQPMLSAPRQPRTLSTASKPSAETSNIGRLSVCGHSAIHTRLKTCPLCGSFDKGLLLIVVSTEETSRPTSLFKTLLSGTVTG